jgi:2-methylcitrate dehydratase PrpD
MTGSITAELAGWVAGVRLEDVPSEVIERVKLVVADILGIMLRARNDSESTPQLVTALENLDLASGRFHVIGDARQYSAFGATLLNATNGHSLELDDTYSERGLHTSCCVVPAALCAAELVGASGRELIAGIVAGLEVMCRLGLGLGVTAGHGFHSTPVTGAFGAAAAAARVLRLSPEQVAHAFGVVLSQTAGNMQFHANGAWTKRFQVGHASASGLLSATLARNGYTGAAEAIEGAAGLFSLYGDDSTPERVLLELGQDWHILRIAFKPHASCRGTHAAIDAAIDIRQRARLRFEDIESVAVGLPRAPLDLIELLAEPEARKRDPRTTVDGQFSIHFCVAVALRLGRLAWDDYKTQFWDPDVRALMQRITVFHDPEAVAIRAGSAAGSVHVRTRSGQLYEAQVTTPRGEPENMLTPVELRVKFDSLVQMYVGEETAAELFQAIMDLDRQPSLDGIFHRATTRVYVAPQARAAAPW